MIVTEAEIITRFRMNTDQLTDQEQAVIQQVHAEAESLVISELGYDPEQKEHTEFYPRHDQAGGTGYRGGGTWDSDGTLATFTRRYGYDGNVSLGRTLQLQHLPLRQVNLLRVSTTGRFNKGSGTPDQWTEGTEFWGQYEAENLCKTGNLIANGSWPLEPGSVVVRYVAGYSPSELSGRADADAVAADEALGIITTPGVNAAAIKRAVLLTVGKALHTQQNLREGDEGFAGGATFDAERWQDYSYKRPAQGGAGASQLTGLVVDLPAEAVQALAPFKHYGVFRL